MFPLGRTLDTSAVRQHTHHVAQRLEDELGEERPSFIDTCPADWADQPRPDLPLMVSLDGGYVHSSQQTSRKDETRMREPEIDIDRVDMSGLLGQAQPDPIPAPFAPPKVPTSVRLPQEVYERLVEIARQRGMGHTQLMLQYIQTGLAAEADAQDAMVPLAQLQQILAQIAVRPPAA